MHAEGRVRTIPAHRPSGTPDGDQFAASVRVEDPTVQLDGADDGLRPTDPGAVIARLNTARQRETSVRRQNREPVPTGATAMIEFLNRRAQERGSRRGTDLVA